MNHPDYKVKAIGLLKTEFETSDDTPIQPAFSQSIGKAIILDEYVPALRSLDSFTHIYLIYWFHKAKEPDLIVTPYLDNEAHGLFSTRAPARPNPIGISIVEIINIENNVITFRGADMLNDTPLIDIKPYVKRFDEMNDVKDGWLDRIGIRDNKTTADDRFEG